MSNAYNIFHKMLACYLEFQVSILIHLFILISLLAITLNALWLISIYSEKNDFDEKNIYWSHKSVQVIFIYLKIDWCRPN
ncbi:hypothetical protein DERP_009662 [Dermatophagoides pteronyssinus]|uniref:Uncharacterized protein n=1 Tax=Dermatophagoides pteronyssinus TaxID=6956 RepID=A0ABQ8JAJ1_DERPT|nr:hypothetical protein DERP_009662 [Dermatophagoides pteronyssinus]